MKQIWYQIKSQSTLIDKDVVLTGKYCSFNEYWNLSSPFIFTKNHLNVFWIYICLKTSSICRLFLFTVFVLKWTNHFYNIDKVFFVSLFLSRFIRSEKKIENNDDSYFQIEWKLKGFSSDEIGTKRNVELFVGFSSKKYLNIFDKSHNIKVCRSNDDWFFVTKSVGHIYHFLYSSPILMMSKTTICWGYR